MDQPPVVPKFNEQIEAWELHVEMLRQLKAASLRIKSSKASASHTVRVDYHNKVYVVAIWEVTERYAIDSEGNVLEKCADSPMNWWRVEYALIPTPSVDHKGREELCERLKQMSARS